MPKHVFFSFDYDMDVMVAARLKSVGQITGERKAYGNEWEEVRRKDDASIRRWIDSQMEGRSTTVVLVGEKTADSVWVQYEIIKTWNEGKRLLGVRIDGMAIPTRGLVQPLVARGPDPFARINLQNGGKLSDHVRLHEPSGQTSDEKYRSYCNNIEAWIDQAAHKQAA